MSDHWDPGQSGRYSDRRRGRFNTHSTTSYWTPRELHQPFRMIHFRDRVDYQHGLRRHEDSLRNAPWLQQSQSDNSAASGHGYTFRGAAQTAPDSQQNYDFSFRAPGPPAPSFPRSPSPRRGQPPTKRVARDRPAPNRHGRNTSGNANRTSAKHRRPVPSADERDILNMPPRGTTPEQFAGMNASAEQRFSNVGAIEHFIEDEATFLQRKAAQEAAPKWTNPDPFIAAAPPVVADAQPKVDLVGVIRRAKRDTEPASTRANLVARNDDFISFDMTDDLPNNSATSSSDGRIAINIPAVEAHPTMPDAPTAPRAMRAQAGVADTHGSINTWASDLAPSTVPAPSTRGQKRKFAEEEVMGEVCGSWLPTSSSNATPWLPHPLDRKQVAPAGKRLNQEIRDFYDYVRPRPFEEAVRLELITRVQNLMNRFPGFKQSVEVHGFGSFASGLYLPCADMDLVALSSSFLRNNSAQLCQHPRQIRDLVRHIRDSGIAAYGSIEPILGARVPLIKFTDGFTGIKVDLSFENPSGLFTCRKVQEWLTKFSEIPVMVSLVKQLLAMREQNEVHTGGFGGFTVICLVVSVLEMMPASQRGTNDQPQDYGLLLEHLLKLYGEQFDIDRTGIAMDPAGYFDKTQSANVTVRPGRLTIIDPNNQDNDISGGSRNAVAIFDMFRRVRNSLQMRLESVQRNVDDTESILGCAWAGNYTQFDEQRDHLRKCFHELERLGIRGHRRDLPDLSRLPRVVVTSLRRIAQASGARGAGGRRR